jgi:inorganic triphosphatase YgiF
MHPAMEIERELKLTLPADQATTLLDAAPVRAAARGEVRRRQVASTYYDTKRHSLRKAGAALRVRTAGEGFEQTLKFAVPGPAGLQNCEEWTVPVPGARPVLQSFDRTVLQRFKHQGSGLKLEPMFTTNVERTTCLLQRGSTHLEIALDRGHIQSHVGSRPTSPICELELELIDGPPAGLYDLALELLEEVDLRLLIPSKAERGYGLVRPALGAGAVKAGKVALDENMALGDAFQSIADEALRHLLSNDQATLRGQPEAIHQSRVAIRRIRAALGAFRFVLPHDQRRAFNSDFRQLQHGLAPARDWHVFRKESLPAITADGLARGRCKELKQLARSGEREGVKRAIDTLMSRDYARTLLRFQLWLLTLASAPDSQLAQPLKPFARRALENTREDFLKDRRPLRKMSEDERHALRKRGKKARYATEFFANLWQGSDVRRYLKWMTRLQDPLGAANDAVVARRVVTTAGPGRLRASTAQRVEAWSRRRERECLRAGQPLWKKAQKVPPFWRS